MIISPDNTFAYVKTGKACKQKFCMKTGLPPGKYNEMYRLFLVKLTSSVLTIHYNATHACTYITMQELIKNHGTMDLQFCMEIFLPRE